MTIKEAIIKVLEDNKGSFTYLQVYDLIEAKNYIDWSNAKTPRDTIGALLGDFIRKNDSRVKRIKGENGYEYYLSKFEKELDLAQIVENEIKTKKSIKLKTYKERDLHILLSSYLKYKNVFSKTIFHEKSVNGKDSHQKWVHPDMVGIDFISLQNKSSNALMKVINKSDAFNISSYEVKKEIKSDYELKKYFFQAVSNSSWANYGYLVAFEISDNLKEEIERLNQSFGIGIISLKSNPYESEVLYPAKYRELDFRTIDKLCEINTDFERFINHTEILLTATDKYIKATEKEFIEFCDKFLKTDSEIENYCIDKNIPIERSDLK